MAGRDKEPGVRPGQPRGEIFFDSVEVPPHHAPSARDTCRRGHASTWSSDGAAVGRVMTGLDSAAFDRAVGRVHERREGGAPPMEHRPDPYRPGRTGSRAETVRSVSRRATECTALAPARHPCFTARSTAMGTGLAFRAADKGRTAGSVTDPHRTEGHHRGDH
ncbi:hypothetical protein [Streptomyces scabiei]|uniref:hypothetical protein n=1 Tax=Streptomyces scabiei TaxID=1930 RepID=UPI000765F8E0|nr:hypothetical protein [Streptomyces scabiei]